MADVKYILISCPFPALGLCPPRWHWCCPGSAVCPSYPLLPAHGKRGNRARRSTRQQRASASVRCTRARWSLISTPVTGCSVFTWPNSEPQGGGSGGWLSPSSQQWTHVVTAPPTGLGHGGAGPASLHTGDYADDVMEHSGVCGVFIAEFPSCPIAAALAHPSHTDPGQASCCRVDGHSPTASWLHPDIQRKMLRF